MAAGCARHRDCLTHQLLATAHERGERVSGGNPELLVVKLRHREIGELGTVRERRDRCECGLQRPQLGRGQALGVAKVNEEDVEGLRLGVRRVDLVRGEG